MPGDKSGTITLQNQCVGAKAVLRGRYPTDIELTILGGAKLMLTSEGNLVLWLRIPWKSHEFPAVSSGVCRNEFGF